MSYTAGTYTAKPSQVTKKWFVIDAEGMVLGRLSAQVAKILRGKHKPSFTQNIDTGDNVVILNAEKIAVTGKKLDQSIFYWHTGHPGGIKGRSIRQRLESDHPERVVEKAIQRMMPKESPLARKQLKCLHVYADATHPHEAQKPEVLDLVKRNSKNKR